MCEKLEHRCKCEESLVYVTLCELPHVNHGDSPQMAFYLLLTGGNVQEIVRVVCAHLLSSLVLQ